MVPFLCRRGRGGFVQLPIIGGLNQPPRLRPLWRLRGISLMGAATPPYPRRGIPAHSVFLVCCKLPGQIRTSELGGKAVDRRIQRTREVLHEALISLMIEKGYEAITVQDIIDRANVGRSTFYAHYVGKQDLLMSGLKNLSRHLLEHQRAALALKRSFPEKGFGFSLALFEHVHSHRNVYHAIVGR